MLFAYRAGAFTLFNYRLYVSLSLLQCAYTIYLCCLFRCILATDMAKHNDILKSFRAVVQIFDWNAKEHRDLVSEV